MSFGQVSTLLLLGFNRFYIVLILRVPADKNICFAIKLVDGITFSIPEPKFPNGHSLLLLGLGLYRRRRRRRSTGVR